jgi:hypothetical protein
MHALSPATLRAADTCRKASCKIKVSMNMQLSDVDALMRHPLLLVIATGLLSSYLIPYFTRRWQNHQKSIETRTQFASQVIQTVVRFLISVQMAERHAIQQDKYDADYQEWEVHRATLESELRGQFKDPGLAADWASLSEAVTALYRLSGTWTKTYRSSVLEELKVFFPDVAADWACLRDHEKNWKSNDEKSNDDFQKYFAQWWKLREAALLRAGDLTSRILEAKTTSFD